MGFKKLSSDMQINGASQGTILKVMKIAAK
jgi:hypothetical protein